MGKRTSRHLFFLRRIGCLTVVVTDRSVCQPRSQGFLERPWEGVWSFTFKYTQTRLPEFSFACYMKSVTDIISFTFDFPFFSEVLKSWIIQKRPAPTPRILFPLQRTRFMCFTSEWTIFMTSLHGKTWRNVSKSGI